MQAFIILLVLLTLVRVWIYELPNMLGRELIPFKPFNCANCLSFWVGVITAICLQNPIFITLYLMQDIYERNL